MRRPLGVIALMRGWRTKATRKQRKRWACRHCWPEPDKGYVIRIFDSAEAAQQFADELNARHPYPGVDDKPGTANEPPGPQAPAGGNEKEK